MDETCAICWNNMDENKIELFCKHSFHIECIETLYESKSCLKYCPCCRFHGIDVKQEIQNKINKINSLLSTNNEINLDPLSYNKIFIEDENESENIILYEHFDNVLFNYDDNDSFTGQFDMHECWPWRNTYGYSYNYGYTVTLKYPNQNNILREALAISSLHRQEITINPITKIVCFKFHDLFKTREKKEINWKLLLQYDKEIKLYQQQIAQNI
uniref:RING-type domain-containing protein n=1 Tax=viral metagenome TaxID=1070528 RepID=A0A6C0H5G0_9ZZZZ